MLDDNKITFHRWDKFLHEYFRNDYLSTVNSATPVSEQFLLTKGREFLSPGI